MPNWLTQPLITERDSQEEQRRQRKARQLREVREFRRRITQSAKKRNRQTYPQTTKKAKPKAKTKVNQQLNLFNEGRITRPSLLLFEKMKNSHEKSVFSGMTLEPFLLISIGAMLFSFPNPPIAVWIGVGVGIIGAIWALVQICSKLNDEAPVIELYDEGVGAKEGQKIHIIATYKQGKVPVTLEHPGILFQKNGLHYFYLADEKIVTLSPNNRKNIYNLEENPFPGDIIIGVFMQDTTPKVHYSKHFPKEFKRTPIVVLSSFTAE